MDHHNTRTVLNDLIGTLKDGQEGYRLAANDVKGDGLHELFDRYSLQRAHFAGELQELLHTVGEASPTNSSTLAGAAHRAWINLKSALTSKDDQAILAECERGDEHALAVYSKALEDELPAYIQDVIRAQATAISSVHTHIQALRSSLVGVGA